MSREADGVPLHALEHTVRKDDQVALDPGQLVEAHLRRSELTALERDHAPPEDVAPADLAAEVGEEAFGVLARGRAPPRRPSRPAGRTPLRSRRGPRADPIAVARARGPTGGRSVCRRARDPRRRTGPGRDPCSGLA